MDGLTIVARTLHFAALVSLAGGFAFLALIAEPAFRAAGAPSSVPRFRKSVDRLAWAGLAVAFASGALWLVLEARAMSGRSLAAVFSRDIIAIVLTRTNFGHNSILRFALAALLVPVMLLRRGYARSAALDGAALVLSAAALALLAWAGHAGATLGTEGDVHLAADVTHLLAAGAWLGGLVPLALLLGLARTDLAWLPGARAATRRFSRLGMISVAALLATGIVNSWILVGTIPGLVGTEYGRLLLVKLALFAAMVAVAGVNRQRLTPSLFAAAAPLPALRALRRNALIETTLGLAILAVVGALGVSVPALHTQPVWPFTFRLDLDAVPPDPALARTAALHGAAVGLGMAALLVAALRRRRRWLMAAFGLVLVMGFGRLPLSWMLVEAYPTSFENPTVAYDAPSLLRGAHLFEANCARCHGEDGRGDGPAAAGLPLKPADLTAAHLLGHRPGDLFWWVSHGLGGVMPAFAGSLSESQRWEVINFVRARAAASQPSALQPEVTPGPVPLAPDFAFEEKGRQSTLTQTRKAGSVLLVLYRLPAARARLEALAAAEPSLKASGLRLLAIPATGDVAADRTPLPDFAAATGPETAAVYGLFAGAPASPDVEFLIDRAGFLRARWAAGAGPGPAAPAELLAQLRHMAEMPLAQAAAHVHAH